MGFNSLVSSRLHNNATPSAGNFAGRVGDDGVCALFPNPLVDRSTTAHVACGEAGLAERTRIAQELHDTLLQGFIAVSMQLHAAVDQLPADCVTEKLQFSKALQLLDRVLEQGRYAVQELRSPHAPLASLGEAFAGVPNDLNLPSAVGFRVTVYGKERPLRTGLRDEVYRIGREAIINACRHSQATNIEVEVEYQPTELRITVRDDGCGIDPEVVQWGRKEHWGLQGMRERAERIGARLRLWSRVAHGTEVQLRVPGRAAFEPVEGRVARWIGESDANSGEKVA